MRLLLAFLMLPGAAFAQAVDAGAGAATSAPSSLASLFPLVLVFFIFYFLVIRPQQKRLKEHQAVLGALKKGDEIVTGGGLIGKITKIGADGVVSVEIAKGVEVTVLRSTVSGLAGAGKVGAGQKNDNAPVSRDSVANDN